MKISAKTKKITAALASLLAIVSMSSCVIRAKINIEDMGPVKKGNFELKQEAVTDKLNVNVNLAVANFSIKRGNQFCVNYNIPQKLIPDVNVSGNTITIDGQEDARSKSLSIENIDDLWNIGEEGSDSFKVELVIPQDMEINDIDLSLRIGVIRLNAINFNDIAAEINLGDCILSDLTCSVMETDIDLGDVKLKEVTCTSVDVDNLLSDIRLESVVCSTVDVAVELGDVKITGIKCESINVDAESGDIDVSGDYAKINASAGLGDITINTDRPEKDVEIKVSVDLGKTKINKK